MGALKSVARQVKAIFVGFAPDGTLQGVQPLLRALDQYAVTIGPWAEAVARRMLTEVSRKNFDAWMEHGHEIGRELRRVVTQTPVGAQVRAMQAENVLLIKSIPLEAAKKASADVQEGIFRGMRSSDVAKVIQQGTSVPLWRAKLIARTETSKAAVALTQARAQALGSEGYVWRTLGDGDVRTDHRAMEGKYVRWDAPPSFPSEPTLGAYHAGCGPNCRCYPQPILPDY